MPRISLVTDSTCDIPADLRQERAIHVIPQHVIFGDKTYRDGTELSSKAFYDKLSQGSSLPTTSQPSAGEFVEMFERARAADNADGVIAITVSSKLSNTFTTAESAARMVDFPVTVIDSQQVSMALGFTVLAAAQAREDGGTLDQIVEVVRYARSHTSIYFTVKTLDYLHRGGRIGGARHFVGTALAIKPILQISSGMVEAAGSVRTRTKSLQRLLEIAQTDTPRGSTIQAAVIHGDAQEEAEMLMTEVNNTWRCDHVLQSTVCSAIGTHAGPGVIGIVVARY